MLIDQKSDTTLAVGAAFIETKRTGNLSYVTISDSASDVAIATHEEGGMCVTLLSQDSAIADNVDDLQKVLSYTEVLLGITDEKDSMLTICNEKSAPRTANAIRTAHYLMHPAPERA